MKKTVKKIRKTTGNYKVSVFQKNKPMLVIVIALKPPKKGHRRGRVYSTVILPTGEYGRFLRIPKCFHTAANPQQPKDGEKLNLSGLSKFVENVAQPAKYSALGFDRGKFSFRQKPGSDFRNLGDWEAEDAGVPPGK
jgi:hypothetical protein